MFFIFAGSSSLSVSFNSLLSTVRILRGAVRCLPNLVSLPLLPIIAAALTAREVRTASGRGPKTVTEVRGAWVTGPSEEAYFSNFAGSRPCADPGLFVQGFIFSVPNTGTDSKPPSLTAGTLQSDLSHRLVARSTARQERLQPVAREPGRGERETRLLPPSSLSLINLSLINLSLMRNATFNDHRSPP